MRDKADDPIRRIRRPPANSSFARWTVAWLAAAVVTHGLIVFIARGVNHFGGIFGCCEFASALLIAATLTKIAHSIWQRAAGRRAVVPLDILLLIVLLCGTFGAVVIIGFYLLPFGLTPPFKTGP